MSPFIFFITVLNITKCTDDVLTIIGYEIMWFLLFPILIPKMIFQDTYILMYEIFGSLKGCKFERGNFQVEKDDDNLEQKDKVIIYNLVR